MSPAQIFNTNISRNPHNGHSVTSRNNLLLINMIQGRCSGGGASMRSESWLVCLVMNSDK